MKHEILEKNVTLLAVLTLVAISFGGLAEIVPLMNQQSATQPSPGMVPRTALEVAGRDVYLREGCYNCHSQQVRSLHEEVMRYGPAATAGESVWDHPFQWGSKRTGPDLSRVGGRYSDDWHRIHLNNPRDVVPESNMPPYDWLLEQPLDGKEVAAMMRALQIVGVPYDDAAIAAAPAAVYGKNQMDALIAYLQSLRAPRPPPALPPSQLQAQAVAPLVPAATGAQP